MITHLHQNASKVHQVWLADDAAGAGKITHLRKWYRVLKDIGTHHGYYVNGSKSWLICKTQKIAEEAKREFGDTVNITTEGKRHLGAMIGSGEYKDEYCQEKVDR